MKANLTPTSSPAPQPLLGAKADTQGARFGAYITGVKECAVRLYDAEGRTLSSHPMSAVGHGYYEASVRGVRAGALYKFVLDDRVLPDPYARSLPQGVHGPAAVPGTGYLFKSHGVVPPLAQQVIYEIHLGTFTDEGTYDAARQHLGYLARLGVRTLELMPVASFAGTRGWGYDGVAHYAPFTPYGSPDDLRRFVDEAHKFGLSVILDVVYNHFGPAGNYLSAYSTDYFVRGADAAATPWGEAPNFACPAMRRYAVENALYWLEEFRFDGLRLDAIHTIVDPSEEHVLRELTRKVKALGGHVLFAEDERNDPAVVDTLGFDAVWADDFHHQLRVTLTGERDGYYDAYAPGVPGIADAINGGWLYQGQIYPVTGRARGKSAMDLLAESFVYCIQNHDQIGNRAFGDRLSSAVPVEGYRAASMLLLFLPMTPLLFMGQEWAASTPFLYFTDHEGSLGDAIARGRGEEFKRFAAFADPAARAKVPDPQKLETFDASKLRWAEQTEAEHPGVLELYRELLYLRRS
ncbi:MAG TPA: malto-oligosyltrehalose trehalohydrolase, partial [Polyangiaceae bacterium]|nr:malto-oligosyltrehalose trehalohydrolase [Polyangiaceae bacterium]